MVRFVYPLYEIWGKPKGLTPLMRLRRVFEWGKAGGYRPAARASRGYTQMPTEK
jgi:hypothetical protein